MKANFQASCFVAAGCLLVALGAGHVARGADAGGKCTGRIVRFVTPSGLPTTPLSVTCVPAVCDGTGQVRCGDGRIGDLQQGGRVLPFGGVFRCTCGGVAPIAACDAQYARGRSGEILKNKIKCEGTCPKPTEACDEDRKNSTTVTVVFFGTVLTFELTPCVCNGGF